MHTVVDQRPTAGKLAVDEGGTGGDASLPMPHRSREVDIAQTPSLDGTLDAEDARPPALAEVDRKLTVRGFGRGDHAARVRGVEHHRPFAEHVQPRLQRPSCQERVQRVRHGDRDEIDQPRVEERLRVGEGGGDTELFGSGGELRLVQVADRDDGAVGGLEVGADVLPAHPESDDARAQGSRPGGGHTHGRQLIVRASREEQLDVAVPDRVAMVLQRDVPSFVATVTRH